MRNILYHTYKPMIIGACPIFFQNAKCDNLAWLKSNNFVILRIFLLHTRSYTFLKFLNLSGKRHLVFENLEINGISFVAGWFKYLWEVSTFKVQDIFRIMYWSWSSRIASTQIGWSFTCRRWWFRCATSITIPVEISFRKLGCDRLKLKKKR